MGNPSFSSITTLFSLTDAKVYTRNFTLSFSTLPCGQWASILHLPLWSAHSYASILQDKLPMKSESLGMILSAFGNCLITRNYNAWITCGDWLVQHSLKAGRTKSSCSGLCPVRFQIFPLTETLKPTTY